MGKARLTPREFADVLLANQHVLIEAYGSRRCVIATRIAVDLAREMDLRADPLAVSADVGHPAIGEGRLGFEPPEHVPPGSWNGHLVCVLDRELLLDLTLDSVRTHGFNVAPLAIDIDSDFLKGGTCMTTMRGTSVTYKAHPEERGFLRLEDWSDLPERRRTMPRIRARLPVQ